MASNNPPSPNSNKRKRLNDSDPNRNKAQTINGSDPSDPYASLLQNLTDASHMGAQDDNSRTAQAALQQQQSSYPEPNAFDHAGISGGFEDSNVGLAQGGPHHPMNPTGQGIFDARQPQANKPAVGSPAWHQLRKDNHKEVERRRREVINEGIENIAKMIPGQDKNKGAVLQNACRYIQELQAKIASFNDERNVFEITQQELTRRNDVLRDSSQRAWQESNKWMNRCRDANLQFDDYDQAMEPPEGLDDATVGSALADAGVGHGSGGNDNNDFGVSMGQGSGIGMGGSGTIQYAVDISADMNGDPDTSDLIRQLQLIPFGLPAHIFMNGELIGMYHSTAGFVRFPPSATPTSSTTSP